MDVIFLGVNDIGMRIYEWLCDHEDTTVQALLTTEEQLEIVGEIDPDLLVSVGYDHLVPPEILTLPSRGAINLHPSYLPYNRGKSPNVWSIVDGTPAGVTLHYMDESFDEGEIIERRRVESTFEDTGKSLHHRLESAQFNLFTDCWPEIVDGTVDTKEQDPESGTFHTTEDFIELCELNPDEKVHVREFLDRLRALTFEPFDNAYLEVDGQRFYINVEITHEDDTGGDTPEGLLKSY